MHLAENSLSMLCAKFLWAFEPRPALTTQGAEETCAITDDSYEPGTTTLPKPFRCRSIPRNEIVVDTFKREWAEARVAGFDLGNKHVDERGIVTGEVK